MPRKRAGATGAPVTGDDPLPSGLRTSALPVGDHSLVVFSYPIAEHERAAGEVPAAPASLDGSDAPGLDVLTLAEREVVREILCGRSNGEIAALRGRSVHTINRQVEAAYRKLGVGSRGELCARFGGRASTMRPRPV